MASRGARDDHRKLSTRLHTDYSKWRLHDESGRHTWHYITDARQLEARPQSTVEKYFLGLATDTPSFGQALTPSQSIRNALEFYSRLQMPSGHWACEYGGPLFLLPCVIMTWYLCELPIDVASTIEMTNYIFAHQNEDDGWGLHVENTTSTVFGTTMNYTALRILGMSDDHPRMVRARKRLSFMGGASMCPHWGKFWLCLLGVTDWNTVNPTPPEIWLLPDWVPFASWRWWLHIRQVALPMTFLWSRKFSKNSSLLTQQLREELSMASEENGSTRNWVSDLDNHQPLSWVMNLINAICVRIWIPYLRPAWLAQRAEAWVWRLIQLEDENTDFVNLAPLNAALNTICCYIQDGPDSKTVSQHCERMKDYIWMNLEGMHVNGVSGVQSWDTALTISFVAESGFVKDWEPMLEKALRFLEQHQLDTDTPMQYTDGRQRRRGAWPCSTKTHGYPLSDTTAEALRAVLLLQKVFNFSPYISDTRLESAVDYLLTMQNQDTGGFAAYEIRKGSPMLELLNASQVFGKIMVDYDCVECTSSVIRALRLFKQFSSYRQSELEHTISRSRDYVHASQRPDGSWYGNWGICFTYGTMFALEALAECGETYQQSGRVRRACEFLLSHQEDDFGWGESYLSSETGTYHPYKRSLVVQTSWACIALMAAQYPHKDPIRKGLLLVLERQKQNGEWTAEGEGIEGIFNETCAIKWPNYKFYFPVKAMAMYRKTWGDNLQD